MAAAGPISATSNGKLPDCECPISTAPFSSVASTDKDATVGLGVGRPEFMSGRLCFASSSTEATGNCSSGYGAPGFGPKRKFGQTTSSLNLRSGV